MMAKLTPKQQAFCDYYIETGNATDSYLKAGYKVKNNDVARTNSSRLLTNANIKTYIENRMNEKQKSIIASQDEVLQFLTSVMRGQVTEQIPIIMSEEFEMVDKNPSVKDRTKAAELLGKRYALFKENLNHSGDLAVTIQVDYGDDDE